MAIRHRVKHFAKPICCDRTLWLIKAFLPAPAISHTSISLLAVLHPAWVLENHSPEADRISLNLKFFILDSGPSKIANNQYEVLGSCIAHKQVNSAPFHCLASVSELQNVQLFPRTFYIASKSQRMVWVFPASLLQKYYLVSTSEEKPSSTVRRCSTNI